jgi:hypothetical protein
MPILNSLSCNSIFCPAAHKKFKSAPLLGFPPSRPIPVEFFISIPELHSRAEGTFASSSEVERTSSSRLNSLGGLSVPSLVHQQKDELPACSAPWRCSRLVELSASRRSLACSHSLCALRAPASSSRRCICDCITTLSRVHSTRCREC